MPATAAIAFILHAIAGLFGFLAWILALSALVVNIEVTDPFGLSINLFGGTSIWTLALDSDDAMLLTGAVFLFMVVISGW